MAKVRTNLELEVIREYLRFRREGRPESISTTQYGYYIYTKLDKPIVCNDGTIVDRLPTEFVKERCIMYRVRLEKAILLRPYFR